MSSLKRAAKIGQRTHRERSQPEWRAQFGHLEKKKDYVKRAADYNAKKKRLLKLRQKALDRNPDEFHFHMVKSRVGDDGVHHELTPEPDEDTRLQKKLGDLRNLKYIRHQLNLENRKIEKLKSTLHFVDMSAVQNTHTIFVDGQEDAKSFDPVSYFNTPEDVLDRKYNRPQTSTLRNQTVLNAVSKEDVKKVDRERRIMYNELLKRIRRAEELKVVVEKLEVRKNIADSKGKQMKPKKIAKGEQMRARVFQWTYERKK